MQLCAEINKISLKPQIIIKYQIRISVGTAKYSHKIFSTAWNKKINLDRKHQIPVLLIKGKTNPENSITFTNYLVIKTVSFLLII